MLIALALTSYAHAEEPTFVGTKTGDETPKVETHLTANLGGNFTAGNSESITFNAGFDFSHKWKRNQIGLVGGAAIGYGAVDADANQFLDEEERCVGATGNDCQSTAERYSAEARYDRFFSKTDSLYVLVGGLHDKFAGFEIRTHGQVGYAKHIISEDKTHLKVEAGVDFANEQYVPGVVPESANLLAVQIAADYSHQFNDQVSFTDGLKIYEPLLTQPDGSPFAPHFTDIRIDNVAAISAKMSDKLSVSVSDTLAWRNEPVAPPEGFEGQSRSNIDNTITVALVASIL